MNNDKLSADVKKLMIDWLNDFATDVELGNYEQLTETNDHVAKTRTISMTRKGNISEIIIPLNP
jgi:hypothetical protein